MFANLNAEMARNRVTNEDIAVCLEVTLNTVSNKISGKTEFTRKDMWKIREGFFPSLSIDYLFDDESTEYEYHKVIK
ncbi:MAG: hypothetical protein IJX99_06430 [Clostridia bacterium]|nr:hypothetical protein [Clostridia bacterium]